MRSIIALITLFVLIAPTSQAQPKIQKNWKAVWITTPDTHVKDYGVYEFRKSFKLDSVPAQYQVQVSADNRYKLFVNGVQLSVGPSLGDKDHWYYQTVDLAPALKAGENELLATVWNEGDNRAVHQFSVQTGFILNGVSDAEKAVNTNITWQCRKLPAYSPIAEQTHVLGFYAATPGEYIDTRIAPTSWEKARGISVGMPSGAPNMSEWTLVPSAIAEPEMTPLRIATVRRAEGVTLPKGFPMVALPKGEGVRLPANSRVSILMDQQELVNAYPRLSFSEGKDATIVLRYAESLYNEKKEKGNRNEIDGKHFVGRLDSIIANGEPFEWESLQWRTFRYLQLDIVTSEQPLLLHDISCVAAVYPFHKSSTAQCSDPEVEQMLAVGWRTAERCAMETYMDCPYYEQLQYVGDTRIQAMISYYNARDDRMARKSIQLINWSRNADGITQGRYPSTEYNYITPFSLAWVGMIYDFYRYRQDNAFVRSQLNGMRNVMQFFEMYQQADGRLESLPYWHFTDWALEGGRNWRQGAAVLDKKGYSALADLQWLQAVQYAAELEGALGEPYLAERYAQTAASLREAIRTNYFDAKRGLFADNGDKKCFSQQANTLAILTGVVEGEEAKAIADKMMNTEEKIVKASIYFLYYVHQALTKVGKGDEYLSRLDIWRKNLQLGLTTWAEESTVENCRSDCHAWGSSPNIEYYRTILGIDADAPGFAKVRIEPHLGALTQAAGTMPHPQGDISASYTLQKKGKGWLVTLTLPEGVTGTFVWKGQEYPLHPGENTFKGL
ncbi:MAG: alpha-rhamnosidase [Bacteroidales bacterium]|nr:alpha-rhamnosidase [Bacteroidales bacterium]